VPDRVENVGHGGGFSALAGREGGELAAQLARLFEAGGDVGLRHKKRLRENLGNVPGMPITPLECFPFN
jgi:hypothetical protein